LHGRFAIVGYGETTVSRARSDKGEAKLSVQEYAAWAAESALTDAGLEAKDLAGQGLGVAGTVYPHSEIYSGEVTQDLGISPKLLLRSDAGGNSGASLLHSAGQAVSSGEVDLVLCLGADTPMSISAPGAMREWRYETDFQKPFGMMGPNSQFAFVTRRHMHQYGTKPEALGKIAVTQRNHAMKNANAYLKSPLTMEQYMASRMIADPVRLFDACISVNGGLAFLVASEEKAKEFVKDKVVWVLGMAEMNNYQSGSSQAPDITYLGIVDAAKRAFSQSGIERKDVDFVQLYDDYTLAVLMELEDSGFCKKGEGGRFVEEHDLSFGGDLPMNTGGGQLSSGQPGMAGGFVHLVEGVRQLRGEGGERQVDDASLGFVTGIGCLGYANSLVQTSAVVLGSR
jgi:acetyl-CoA acetyltransferase